MRADERAGLFTKSERMLLMTAALNHGRDVRRAGHDPAPSFALAAELAPLGWLEPAAAASASRWKMLEENKPDSAKAWLILAIAAPAMLWVFGVLWLLDREDYHRMGRWCFEDRRASAGGRVATDREQD